MGIYSNHTEKKVEIKKKLIQLQTTIEALDGIVTDHGYVELATLVEELSKLHDSLDNINNMGVGFAPTKKIFKIDVGAIPEDEIEDYIKKVAAKFKKNAERDDVEQPPIDFKIEGNDSDITYASEYNERTKDYGNSRRD
jgi:hypothetical protein